jgi:hypothetical protein
MKSQRVAALLILLVLAWAGAERAGAADTAVALKDVSIEQGSGSATVTVRTTGPASYEAMTLYDPMRLVIDFKGVTYAPGKSRWTSGVDPIKEVRGAQWQPGIARVVVELTRRAAYRIYPADEGVVVVLEPSISAREPVPASIKTVPDEVIVSDSPAPPPKPETAVHLEKPPAPVPAVEATTSHALVPAPKPEPAVHVEEPPAPVFVVEATTQDGRNVELKSDGTWKYAAAHPRRLNGMMRARPHGARLLLAGREVAYGLWIDPSTWRPPDTKGNAAAEYEFVHVKGGGRAMVIPQAISVPADGWKQIVLDNARKVAPDARITREERATVNGVDVLVLQTEGTARDGPFVLYGHYYAGKQRAIQVITSTRPELFEQYRADFTNLLNGFVLLE